ncbi:MAG: metallophosphoesterase [Gemmatimonadaceae bacterium]
MRLSAATLALPFALFVAAPVCAQTSLVQGSVFADQNRNGRRDPGERGLANVSVSNQDAVVTTDSAGEFRIARGPNDIVFVSAPDNYQSVGRFWRSVSDSPTRVEFALIPARSPDVFTFAHASDTHISPASVNRTQRLRTLVDSMRPAFVLIAGDLVKDALRVSETEATSYYDLFMQEFGHFATPVFTVPGNHENFGIEQKLSHVDASNPLFGRSMYHHYLGPDYYSFTYGGVHFVGLNTVDIDGPSYYGHVDSLQLAWLARDLARIPSTMPVVTFDHIPMASTMETFGGYTDSPPAPTLITVRGKTVFRHVVSNAAEVLTVLRVRPHVLALGAHIHAGEKISYEIDGVKTRFEQSPAVIGPSQRGPLTFPSGFTIYTVRKGVIDAGQFVPIVVPATARPHD